MPVASINSSEEPRPGTARRGRLARRFRRDENGVTAIEYGLIAALIAVVIIASVRAVGTNLQTVFTSISTALTPAAPAAGG